MLNSFFEKGLLLTQWTDIVMMGLALTLLWLALVRKFEPLLLVPIGFGLLLGNIPVADVLGLNIYAQTSPFYAILVGVKSGLFPCLVFLGIGAMTDFSPLLARPKLLFLGLASPLGVLSTFLIAQILGFDQRIAASIAMIAGADGPSTIFLSTRLAPDAYLAPIAIAAYSYMSLVPIIQPAIIRALTTPKERRIPMTDLPKRPRRVLVLFPIVAFIAIAMLVPASLPLLGMLFFGQPA